MSRRRTIALGALFAASLVAWALLHSVPAPRVQPAAGTSATEATGHGAIAPPPTAQAPRSEPSTATTIAADAEHSARLWTARADAVTHAKNARMFNEDVAGMMALPADEAWAALVHAARDGDLEASSAALLVANECKLRLERASTQDAEANRMIDRATAEPLPSNWAGFLRALDAQQ